MNFSLELINKECDNKLFECSFIMIKLFLKQYKEKKINIIDFKTHTTNKINYMLNNFSIIIDTTEKNNIEDLINECISINNTLKT